MPISIQNIKYDKPYMIDGTKWNAYNNGNRLFRSAFLSIPIITSPVNNATSISTTPTITINNPTVIGQSITLKEVQVSTSNTFSSMTWTSGQVAYSTSTTVGVTLSANMTYYIRIRLNGSITGWTNWSNVITFTTVVIPIGSYWLYGSNGSFTIPVSGNYQIVIIAGGGGGGCGDKFQTIYGGGGGGGGYIDNIYSLSFNNYISFNIGYGGGHSGECQSGNCPCGYSGYGGTGSGSSVNINGTVYNTTGGGPGSPSYTGSGVGGVGGYAGTPNGSPGQYYYGGTGYVINSFSYGAGGRGGGIPGDSGSASGHNGAIYIKYLGS